MQDVTLIAPGPGGAAAVLPDRMAAKHRSAQAIQLVLTR
jgi:hypothetical protein